jgi:hypothetical protein
MAKATGIRRRHGRACRERNGGRCNCEPTFVDRRDDDADAAPILVVEEARTA